MVECGRKWGIDMLMGEYRHNIDEKNRLVIPSKFRQDLGSEFVITRGLDKCIFVFPKSTWETTIANLKTLPFTRTNARNFTRFLLSGAAICEFDNQGRISITSPLIEYAGINKECVVIGANDRLEIWSKESWEKFMKDNEDEFENIAENLFDSGDINAL